MARYLVQVRPRPQGFDAARDLVVTVEGFSWAAFLFGPLWFVNQGAWITAALDGAAMLALGVLTRFTGDLALAVPLILFWRLWLGFEAHEVRTGHARALGFEDRAVVAAADEETAAALWLARRVPAASPPAAKTGKPGGSALFPAQALARLWARKP